jgi:hypothetical protein
MNDSHQNSDIEKTSQEETKLIEKIVSLKAADLILDMIKQNQVNKDDEIVFLEKFFDINQQNIKRDVKVETISLWLVKHGYGTAADQFKTRLTEFIKQELEPLVNRPLSIEQFTGLPDD